MKYPGQEGKGKRRVDFKDHHSTPNGEQGMESGKLLKEKTVKKNWIFRNRGAFICPFCDQNTDMLMTRLSGLSTE